MTKEQLKEMAGYVWPDPTDYETAYATVVTKSGKEYMCDYAALDLGYFRDKCDEIFFFWDRKTNPKSLVALPIENIESFSWTYVRKEKKPIK